MKKQGISVITVVVLAVIFGACGTTGGNTSKTQPVEEPVVQRDFSNEEPIAITFDDLDTIFSENKPGQRYIIDTQLNIFERDTYYSIWFAGAHHPYIGCNGIINDANYHLINPEESYAVTIAVDNPADKRIINIEGKFFTEAEAAEARKIAEAKAAEARKIAEAEAPRKAAEAAAARKVAEAAAVKREIESVTENQFKILQNQDGGITITGFTGNQKNIRIPATISGIPVTRIGKEVFYSSALAKKDLESVILPDGITLIDDEAFYGNKLQTIVLPNRCKNIIGDAFAGNPLTSITIGSNVRFVEVTGYNQISGRYYTSLPFEQSFINFYTSQGKKAGTYVKNDRGLWSLKN
jgi:hypothetical protein